jgi:predicted RNase H-like nuclease
LDANRYKESKGAARRSRLLESFRAATEKWVLISDSCYSKCIKNDDAFDALVASLTARAASIGQCQPIDPIDLDAAASEGWIALPRPGSLGRLIG